MSPPPAPHVPGTTDPRGARTGARTGEAAAGDGGDPQLEWISPLRYTVEGQSPFAGELSPDPLPSSHLVVQPSTPVLRGGFEDSTLQPAIRVCSLYPCLPSPFMSARGILAGQNVLRLAAAAAPVHQPSSASATATERSRTPTPTALPSRLPLSPAEREQLLQDEHRYVAPAPCPLSPMRGLPRARSPHKRAR